MGWISRRHMQRGGTIGGMKGKKHKGPLREVRAVLRFGTGMFDHDSVIFECGHQGFRSVGANRGRCAKCGRQSKHNECGPPDSLTDII